LTIQTAEISGAEVGLVFMGNKETAMDAIGGDGSHSYIHSLVFEPL
jgi:hypothetical protein